jgi:hypothetical protein
VGWQEGTAIGIHSGNSIGGQLGRGKMGSLNTVYLVNLAEARRLYEYVAKHLDLY